MIAQRQVEEGDGQETSLAEADGHIRAVAIFHEVAADQVRQAEA